MALCGPPLCTHTKKKRRNKTPKKNCPFKKWRNEYTTYYTTYNIYSMYYCRNNSESGARVGKKRHRQKKHARNIMQNDDGPTKKKTRLQRRRHFFFGKLCRFKSRGYATLHDGLDGRANGFPAGGKLRPSFRCITSGCYRVCVVFLFVILPCSFFSLQTLSQSSCSTIE